MGRLFGTDGVRGLANGDLLTPSLALRVGEAAARVLLRDVQDRRPVAVIGRDGRASGEMLEGAVVAGLTSAGADVIRVGMLPTPALAFLTAHFRADLGVMLSASHNPMPDNGIKIFAAGGHKLPDDTEAEIEALILDDDAPWQRPTGADVGRVTDHAEGAAAYADHLLTAVPADLSGLKVVVDCAHGASSLIAPEAYRRAGADVVVMGAEPNGTNINDGVGSTHLDSLRAAVVEHGADLGIAHDGDADRCLAVDAAGKDIDGDQILAICAIGLKEAGELTDDTVVATVMSNLGFHNAMAEHGISVATTAVGDRYVLERLRADRLALGGEQSGHVVFLKDATTGDGLLTALHLMARMAQTGRTLAELGSVVTRLPQVMINVPVADRERAASARPVAEAVRRAEVELAGAGRILLRPSGTEQLVRGMVEAPSEDQAERGARKVADSVAATR
ncbi:phosphoglucosamine mutase [Blastococcus sp. Marseille-P5729]|uniref:phosphoglucosamine mutase n=1 Tax=Blastococcus sp. Marseille-P5729 TaxID=2086582 RepID=UPI000D0E9DA8|nr:phosphoglucosamine mutase [Blastococcus sp. Marseille-P5729]